MGLSCCSESYSRDGARSCDDRPIEITGLLSVSRELRFPLSEVLTNQHFV